MLRTAPLILIPILALAAGVSAQVPGAYVTEPVVVTGDGLPTLVGRQPGRIVAFRYAGGWQQIPLQVDERAEVSFAQIRQNSAIDFSATVYTDANTFTGADPDSTFDRDDELCFMARDIGGLAGDAPDPAGTLDASRVPLDVVIGGARVGMVYLFESDGSLSPGAGQDHVAYRFGLLSGDYRTTYRTASGFNNPENSRIVTPSYRLRFRDRWIMDQLRITDGTASGADVIDRLKFSFAPGNCNRSSDTFSQGGGAIIANVDGPVRVIRSVVGANSGRVTQRDTICYRDRFVTRTYLRVHRIGGSWVHVDHSPNAVGMTYRDNLNRAGFTIDGQSDAFQAGVMEWQLVDGALGSLATAYDFATDIPNWSPSAFYFDEAQPSFTQCTGDAFAYADSGPSTGGLPNTDPMLGPANVLTIDAHMWCRRPGATVADVVAFHAAATDPARVEIRAAMVAFGAGCAGSNQRVPRIDGAGAPQIGGGGFTIQLRDAVPGIPAPLTFGFSRRLALGTLPLPLALDTAGAPGCSLLIDTPLSVGLMTDAQGRTDRRFRVPNDPNLVGAALFLQFFPLDRAANALGVVASDAMAVTLGV